MGNKNPKDESAESAKNQDGTQGEPTQEKPGEPYPKNTPVAEMTLEQRAAYYKHQSRKMEEKLERFGNYTPEQVQTLAKEAADAKNAALTENEKALETAREEGRAELRRELARIRVDRAIETRLTGRTITPTAILQFDRDKFIKGDSIDEDALDRWVEDNTQTVSQKPIDFGQGRGRDTASGKGGATGKELYEKRHPTKGVGNATSH